MSRHEQAALKKFLDTGEPASVGKFIAVTPKLQEDMLDYYGPDLSLEAVIDNLKGRSREIIKDTREFLKEYLNDREKLPTQRLPAQVQREANFADAKENLGNVIPSLVKSGKTIGKGFGVIGLTHFTVALTDAYAGAMSLLGARESHRQILLSSVFAGTMMTLASGQAQAAISQSEIDSTRNDFNTSSYAETVAPKGLMISGDTVDIEEKSEYLLSPYLVQQLETNANSRQLMVWIVDAALKNGLDPVLFANQMYRESMHFKHSIVYGPDTSPAGAMGIAQVMPYNGTKLGLNSPEDFFNPEKQLYAAARHMSDLTAEYDDQCLAMAAYNGGGGSVDFVKDKLDSNHITCQQWLDFMDKRYEEIGETKRTAWHVETREYVGDVSGQNWDAKYTQWAVKLQDGGNAIKFLEDILSDNDAVAAINALAPSSPG